MSFRCEFCGKVQPPGTKLKKIITEIREVGSPQIEIMGNVGIFLKGAPWQIVREKKACPLCAKISIEPEVVEAVGK